MRLIGHVMSTWSELIETTCPVWDKTCLCTLLVPSSEISFLESIKGDMESLRPEFAFYAIKIKFPMTDTVIFPISEVCTRGVTLESLWQQYCHLSQNTQLATDFGFSGPFFAKCNSFLQTISLSIKTHCPQKRNPVLTRSS